MTFAECLNHNKIESNLLKKYEDTEKLIIKVYNTVNF